MLERSLNRRGTANFAWEDQETGAGGDGIDRAPQDGKVGEVSETDATARKMICRSK